MVCRWVHQIADDAPGVHASFAQYGVATYAEGKWEERAPCLQALAVQRPDRPGQVAEGGGLVEVQDRGGVVSQHPGEHRVLVQVVVRAPSKCVELQPRVQHAVDSIAGMSLLSLCSAG